jgi:hypothetical protein
MSNLGRLTSKSWIFPLLLIGMWACGGTESDERLAKKHCATCHQYPEPTLLDKRTWREQVFPEMAFRMGLDISKLPGTNAYELHEILQALPATPLVSEQQFRSIRHITFSMHRISFASLGLQGIVTSTNSQQPPLDYGREKHCSR